MIVNVLTDGMVCEVFGCGKPATCVAYWRTDNQIVACCDAHYDFIVEQDNPEYTHCCENCGCDLPIN